MLAFLEIRRISMFSGFWLVKKGMISVFGVLGLILNIIPKAPEKSSKNKKNFK